MISRGKVQLIVAIALGVILAASFITGKESSSTLLRLYSLIVTIVMGLFVAYERYIWRWKWVRKISGVPLLAGTWRGSIISSFKREGKQIDPIPVAIYIAQTASTICVTLFTDESSSTSEKALLIKDIDGRQRLSWQYINTPRPTARNRSDIHHGASELYVGAQPGEGLAGSYFTDRSTHGEITLNEWSPKRYSGAATVHEAPGFTAPQPYA